MWVKYTGSQTRPETNKYFIFSNIPFPNLHTNPIPVDYRNQLKQMNSLLSLQLVHNVAIGKVSAPSTRICKTFRCTLCILHKGWSTCTVASKPHNVHPIPQVKQSIPIYNLTRQIIKVFFLPQSLTNCTVQ